MCEYSTPYSKVQKQLDDYRLKAQAALKKASERTAEVSKQKHEEHAKHMLELELRDAESDKRVDEVRSEIAVAEARAAEVEARYQALQAEVAAAVDARQAEAAEVREATRALAEREEAAAVASQSHEEAAQQYEAQIQRLEEEVADLQQR